jgi:hypothetical protein
MWKSQQFSPSKEKIIIVLTYISDTNHSIFHFSHLTIMYKSLWFSPGYQVHVSKALTGLSGTNFNRSHTVSRYKSQ